MPPTAVEAAVGFHYSVIRCKGSNKIAPTAFLPQKRARRHRGSVLTEPKRLSFLSYDKFAAAHNVQASGQ